MTASAPPALNALRARLDRGEVAASMVVRISRGVEIVAIAKAAGFHTLYVDIEHAPVSIDQAMQICVAAQFAGVTPLVRIPEGRVEMIGRVLDGGAQGVIVPHITCAADAEAAVAAARFPPEGTRSVAGPAIQLQYEAMPLDQASSRLNAGTLVGVMVECEAAVDAVEEIAAVSGVDLLLVGANDLLGDMGLVGQYDHPRLAAAYRRVLDACNAHGKHLGVGGLSSRLDLAKEFVRMGAKYVSVGTDTAFLLRGARGAVADVSSN